MSPFRTTTLALATAAALLAGCATAPAPREPVPLRVIAFNDLHGHLQTAALNLPHPNPANPAQPLRVNVGGTAELAGLVKALRAGAPHSVVVSSGDAIGGTPLISALFFHEATIDVMNRIGASGLLADIEAVLEGAHRHEPGTGPGTSY